MSPTTATETTATSESLSATHEKGDTSAECSDNPVDKIAKPLLQNSFGYHSRVFRPHVCADLFYNRLVQKTNRDNFRDSYVHETYLHPQLCREWVQHYKCSTASHPPNVCLPFSALLELSLSSWLKTSLLRSGSLDKNLEPCKSYSFILLCSIWSQLDLMPVKAQPKPPYAPRLWTIVAQCEEDEEIEIHGLNSSGEKSLLMTCEGCHFGKDSFDDSILSNNMVGNEYLKNGETFSEVSLQPLPEPSSLYKSIQRIFVEEKEKRSSLEKVVSREELRTMHMDKFPSCLPLTAERIIYGPPFQLIPSMVQTCGILGQQDFTIVAQLCLDSLCDMQDQYLIPPPLLEGMIHLVLNTFFINSLHEGDKVIMLPRAVAIEGFYVDYQSISKIFQDSKTCSVMVKTTSSRNIHDYDIFMREDDDSANEQGALRKKNALNLDCSLISSDKQVIAHAINVLYCYEMESDSKGMPGISEDPQTHRLNSPSSSSRDNNLSKPRHRKRRKKEGDEKPLTSTRIYQQVRSIALMFVDEDQGSVVNDDSILTDSGWDSLASAEFIGKLSSTFQVNLPPTLLFNYQTINEIHQHLIDLLLVPEDGKDVVSLSTSSGNDEEYVRIDDTDFSRDDGSGEDSKRSHENFGLNDENKEVITSETVDMLSVDEKEMVVEGDDHIHERGTGAAVRSRTWVDGHSNGNTVNGNPWFSVFYASTDVDLRYRMVLCTGQAQGTSPWCSFAEVLNSAGIDVYLVRIPGQFERGDEPPFEGSFAEICESVCNSLADLGCLDDESGIPIELSCVSSSVDSKRRSPAVPLVMLGFSLGTCFNIGIVQLLQKMRGVEVSHVTSMGGLTHPKMKTLKSQNVPYTPVLLKETLVEFFGRAPDGLHQFLDTADEDSISTIMRYFDEGFRYAREWMAEVDERNALLSNDNGENGNRLETDFLWIVGSRDISCPTSDNWWKIFVGEKNTVEILIYPGDHYFHVESPEADRAVAIDVARCLLRKLQVYTWDSM